MWLNLMLLKHDKDNNKNKKSAVHLQPWYHPILGASVVTTLIRAINNNWITIFPGLTANSICKHLPKSIQTTIGHLHKVRKILLNNKSNNG